MSIQARIQNARYDVTTIQGLIETCENFREERKLTRALGKARKALRTAQRAQRVMFDRV